MTNPLSRRRTSRRTFLTVAGAGAAAAAVGGSGLLAGCDSSGGNKGPGTTSKDDINKIIPNYIQNTSVKADIPSVTGAAGAVSDPVFLSYPASPVQTVPSTPGSGGSYTTMTPLWGAIPPASGNAYYDAVNQALGTTLKIQAADGNNYGDTLPPLFAADKLPDWIQIPGWNTTNLNFGSAVAKFVDLTPYLSGDKISAYPNLANIPSGAWSAGVWNGKLYGLPVYPSNATFAGAVFFRRDIFDKQGINPDSIKTAEDLKALGAQLTSKTAGQYAFGDVFGDVGNYAAQLFGFHMKWDQDATGKIVHSYETEGIIAALEWHASLAKAGYIHPADIARTDQNAKQRFWSGKTVIAADGTGAWNGQDAKSGTAANPGYVRQAFKLLSASAGQTPSIELQPGASMFAYLNAKLTEAQVKELLAVANYLAAPYGSKEWLVVNFGAEGQTYTMKDGNPVLSESGSKLVATTFQFLVTAPAVTTVQEGFTQVAKDYAAWQADTVKYARTPIFFGMNITEPAQYSSIGQAVQDTISDVKVGRKPISAFTDAVAAWRKNGGDELRKFYDDIRSKYVTGASSAPTPSS
ncbi:hypothetical protein [Luedemannella helvata]|uniref:Extracellular solute-binding protein n=1 Tax=Luedemannella helvata TaxID=349315 RepID=A0ABN2KTG9_9ACTN